MLNFRKIRNPNSIKEFGFLSKSLIESVFKKADRLESLFFRYNSQSF